MALLLATGACSSHRDTHGNCPVIAGFGATSGDGLVVQDGDPGFDGTGVVSFNFGSGARTALTAVAQQSDGKLIGAGATEESLVVLRATSDGQLDPSFGMDGVVQIPLGLPAPDSFVDDNQVGVAVSADDKIVVAGAVQATYAPTTRDAVFRLDKEGAFDTSFGSAGRVLVDENIAALGVTRDGKVVISEGDALLRLGSDGSPDPSFGSGGLVQLAGSAAAIAIGADGSIVTAGAALSRYLPTGAIDTSFGSGGTLALPDSAFDAVALTTDGKVVAGGDVASAPNAPALFAVVRATAAGVLDPTFGSGGILTDGTTSGSVFGLGLTSTGIIALGGESYSDSDSSGITPTCMVIGSDGKSASRCALSLNAFNGVLGSPVVLADDSAVIPGESIESDGTSGASLTKMTPTGATDPSFGSDGLLQQAIGGSFDDTYAVALQADGSVVTAGVRAGIFWPVRLTSTGALDTAFESAVSCDEAMPTSGGALDVFDVEVQPGGKIELGAGSVDEPFMVQQFDATGATDPTFGNASGGLAETYSDGFLPMGYGQTIAPDRSIYMVGKTTMAGQQQFALVHFTATGYTDESYGSDAGIALSAFTGSGDIAGRFVSAGSDSSVIALGTAPAPTAIRFDAHGILDTTFGGSGQLAAGNPAGTPLAMVRQSDGKLLAVTGVSATGEVDVVRFTAAGTIDPAFGSGGTATVQLGGGNDYAQLGAPAGLVLDAAGNVLVGLAVAAPDGLTEQAAILRLTPNGAPDPSWGPGGVRTYGSLSSGSSAIHALRFQPDGKLLVAGRRWTPEGSSDLMVVRLDY